MNLETSWYLIEHQQRLELVEHADLQRLAPDSYLILFNAPTHREAMAEMVRLLRLEVADTRDKLNSLGHDLIGSHAKPRS